MSILTNISKCLYMQILFQYQSENKMCWKKCLGTFKHICKLFSCVEVRELSENSQFLLYISMAFKNRHISQNLILRSKSPSPFNLFLQSLGCQSSPFWTLSKALFLSTTRWQVDPLFGTLLRPRPTGSCHVKELSLATPRVQHPRCGQRHRPSLVPWLAAEIFTWQRNWPIPAGSKTRVTD